MLYRKHKKIGALARVTLTWGKRTNEFLGQLCHIYRGLKGQVISQILEEFLNKQGLQEEFKKYSADFSAIDDDNLEYEFKEIDGKSVKTIHHTNYEIPKKTIEEINKMLFDFRFVDRAIFIRGIIHFFYDKNFSQEKREKAENLKAKVTDMGYNVVSSGVIDGEIFIRVK